MNMQEASRIILGLRAAGWDREFDSEGGREIREKPMGALFFCQHSRI